jgi:hypothetical protein
LRQGVDLAADLDGQQVLKVKQVQHAFSVGQHGAKVRSVIAPQGRQGLPGRFKLLEVGNPRGEQAEEAAVFATGLRHEDDPAAEVCRALAGADQPVQVEHGHDLAAIDKHAAQPCRAIGQRLKPHAGHHLLDAADVQGEAVGTDLEDESEHGMGPSKTTASGE